MTATPIYLDHAATTPLRPGVLEAMQTALTIDDANASSPHRPGRRAAALVDRAAAQLGALIGADPERLIWTSGATESIDLALAGSVGFDGGPAHVVTVATEHRATLDTLARLERQGTRVTRLGVDRGGHVDLDALSAALADGATLLSVMWVNNETGVIHDIDAIAALCQRYGVRLHVDAAQGLGRLAIDMQRTPIDLLSISAHKIGGPKGAGALYCRERVGLSPRMHGGGQQRGLRPGTLATHQIAGFGAAAAAIAPRREEEQARLAGLRERLWQRLADVEHIERNGNEPIAAPFLNVGVDGVDGQALLTGLWQGEPALAVSAGAACSAAKAESSYVLRAMGRTPRRAGASVRFSLGHTTTAADIEHTATRFVDEVARLRSLATAP